MTPALKQWSAAWEHRPPLSHVRTSPRNRLLTFRSLCEGLSRYQLFLCTNRLGKRVNSVIVAHPNRSKSVQIEAVSATPAAIEGVPSTDGGINESPAADISKLFISDLTTLVGTHDHPHTASTETATATTTTATTLADRGAQGERLPGHQRVVANRRRFNDSDRRDYCHPRRRHYRSSRVSSAMPSGTDNLVMRNSTCEPSRLAR